MWAGGGIELLSSRRCSDWLQDGRSEQVGETDAAKEFGAHAVGDHVNNFCAVFGGIDMHTEEH